MSTTRSRPAWLAVPDLAEPASEETPGTGTWPFPVARRLAFCLVADAVIADRAAGRTVIIATPVGRPIWWRGLATWLADHGARAEVADPPEGTRPEPVGLPPDLTSARAAGPTCRRLLGAEDRPLRYLAVTVGVGSEVGWTVLTEEGWRTDLPPTALLDRVEQLRPGQRLHALVDDGRRVVSAWY